MDNRGKNIATHLYDNVYVLGTRTSAVLQRVVWMWNHIHDQLSHMFESDPVILKQRLDIERQVCLLSV